MWFTKSSDSNGDELDRIRVEFTADSGVQVYNRTLMYKGNGTDGTNARDKSIGMFFDEEFTGVRGGKYSGVSAKVTADIESYGVNDSLEVSLSS